LLETKPNKISGMLWLDIEGPSAWSTDPAANVQFISSLISEAQSLGFNLGIYTGESQWSPITNNWSGASKYILYFLFIFLLSDIAVYHFGMLITTEILHFLIFNHSRVGPRQM
jgi:hypothetical protein